MAKATKAPPATRGKPTKPAGVATPTRKVTPKAAAPAAPTTTSPTGTGASTPGASTPGAVEAYQLYLLIAQVIPLAKVVPYRQNPAVAWVNVMAALAALAPYRAQLAALPAPFDIRAFDTIAGIALATVYAAAQVDLSSPGTIAPLRKAVSASRTLLLKAALALAAAGLIPAAAVKRIQKGSGVRNFAQDCIDLAQLFITYASAIAGKSPITQDQIDTASRVGNQLLQLLKPANAKSVPRNVAHPAVAIRDQFGMLLETTYQQIVRAARWIWAEEAFDHIPALYGHAVHKKKAPKAPTAPTKPTAPTAPTAPTIT